MAFRTFARDVVWDAIAGTLAVDDALITAWSSPTGGYQLQIFNVLESPSQLRTVGGAHAEFKLDNRDDAWLDAGSGRWHRWSVEAFQINAQATIAASDAAAAAQQSAAASAVSAAQAAAGGGGGPGTGGGGTPSVLDLAYYFANVNV